MAFKSLLSRTDQIEMSLILKSRPSVQQKAYGYLLGEGGCSKLGAMSESEFDKLVKEKANSTNFRERALQVIGLDESQVQEIEPIRFEGYDFDTDDVMLWREGKDHNWRTPKYHVSMIFCTDTQVFVYTYLFSLISYEKEEFVHEFFYSDITHLSTGVETREKILKKKGCFLLNRGFNIQSVLFNNFQLSAKGADYSTSITYDQNIERAINGLKTKIREKKNG